MGRHTRAIIGVAVLVAMLFFVVFVPILYSDHPCVDTYGSVSYRIFGFGEVYVSAWGGNPMGIPQGGRCSPPSHFTPYYVFNW